MENYAFFRRYSSSYFRAGNHGYSSAPRRRTSDLLHDFFLATLPPRFFINLFKIALFAVALTVLLFMTSCGSDRKSDRRETAEQIDRRYAETASYFTTELPSHRHFVRFSDPLYGTTVSICQVNCDCAPKDRSAAATAPWCYIDAFGCVQRVGGVK